MTTEQDRIHDQYMIAMQHANRQPLIADRERLSRKAEREYRAAMAECETYKVIRFRFDGENQVIKRGLTLEEAQAHCQDPRTHGEGWFDGYESERR